MTPLDGWSNFYVIVGSSAGALIGLQFVVITLIANSPVVRKAAQASTAFSTPSVVHFCLVLLLSALLSAPWQGISRVSFLWGLIGLGGFLYELLVIRRMRKQTVYTMVFEDTLFHVLLPLTAYGMLAISAFTAHSNARPALFVVALAALLLLFIGIHNAWDGITYHVFVHTAKKDKNEGEKVKDEDSP